MRNRSLASFFSFLFFYVRWRGSSSSSQSSIDEQGKNALGLKTSNNGNKGRPESNRNCHFEMLLYTLLTHSLSHSLALLDSKSPFSKGKSRRHFGRFLRRPGFWYFASAMRKNLHLSVAWFFMRDELRVSQSSVFGTQCLHKPLPSHVRFKRLG